MTFIYNRDIPDGPHNPSADQPLMKENTNSTDNLIAVDHYSFNLANGGKHKQVELPVSISDFPNILGQGTLYSKVSGFGNDAQAFWRFASGARAPLQITGPQYSSGINGYVPLMNGMMIQWGIKTITGTTSTVLFATSNVVFPTNCFNVIVVGINIGTNTHTDCVSVQPGSVSINGFNCIYSGGAAFGSFYWIALGN